MSAGHAAFTQWLLGGVDEAEELARVALAASEDAGRQLERTMPLAVLTADVDEQRGWPAAQAKLAQLSKSSIHRFAQGATHSALLKDRRYATIAGRTIGDVVRAAPNGRF